MKRILVTGGAGMIGSNLVKRLVKDRAGDVFVADNLWRGRIEYLKDIDDSSMIDLERNFFKVDLRDPNSCRMVTEGIDEVYHLADVVAGIGYVFSHQKDVFHDNLLIDTNILKASADAGVKRFIYVGTACSYPKAKQFGVEAPPLVEEDIMPAEPESAYGWSKLIGELQTDLYGRETDMKTGVMRFHNVYGTPTDFSSARSQVIPSLITKAITYPQQEFVVWGSGSQGRSFVHVEDIADGLVRMMEKGLGMGTIQLGNSCCTSIRELVDIVVKVSGKKIEVKYDLSKPEGDRGRCGDCRKAETILGWKQTIDLYEGIGRTYMWIENKMVQTQTVL